MPRQRPLHQYDAYFWELFNYVVQHHASMSIVVADEKRAKTLRVEFYNFRYALRDEVRRHGSRGVSDMTKFTQRNAEQVSIYIEKPEGEPPRLVLTPTYQVPELREVMQDGE